jgi:hypothetical protein
VWTLSWCIISVCVRACVLCVLPKFLEMPNSDCYCFNRLCVVTQSPKAGADTRNFDIHAKRSETDEWSLVGRPSWLASPIPENVAFMLDRKDFMMPDSEEVTLFEPLVHDSLQDIPGPFFFYGVGFFLFGLLGFLRFYTTAPWSMVVSSFFAIFLEFVIGNLNIPNADDHVRFAHENAPSKLVA